MGRTVAEVGQGRKWLRDGRGSLGMIERSAREVAEKVAGRSREGRGKVAGRWQEVAGRSREGHRRCGKVAGGSWGHGRLWGSREVGGSSRRSGRETGGRSWGAGLPISVVASPRDHVGVVWRRRGCNSLYVDNQSCAIYNRAIIASHSSTANDRHCHVRPLAVH